MAKAKPTSKQSASKRLAALKKAHQKAEQKYVKDVLALCKELPPREAFEARLQLTPEGGAFEINEDESEGNYIVYEAYTEGMFYFHLEGEEDPRYSYENCGGEYQDHDVYCATVTLRIHGESVSETE
ncbi:hypothetical protein KIPB_007879 [Kipferlia bialata]|uniref:Uncharacterized protein n=1 Tax=Kipferlia bialata TaxID=797122 RepID=A0A391NX85_9EUKA|nr:hypothetical protein KIPB_007879 [Kipferlia bialata]|eukprot:g7879.t1